MVYFVRIPDSRIKIGFTDDFGSRWWTLRSTYGKGTKFIAAIAGTKDDEKAIHSRFAYALSEGDELFRPTIGLEEFIQGLPGAFRDVAAAKDAGRRRVVLYLDPGVFRRVRDEHVERDIPVSHVVEEILVRHYGDDGASTVTS